MFAVSANPAETTLPELGVGITYSSAIESLIRQSPDLFDVIEVEPQTTWLATRDDSAPYRIAEHVLEHIAQLPGRKLVHSVGTPVGGTVRPDTAQLALLRRTIERFAAPWASDHLSFNATPEFNTGFFLPPRQTSEGVATVVTSIRDLEAALPVPIAVETGVNYLRPRPDELPDGAFVAAVVGTANCGLLLDLHNIFANSLNGRQPIADFLTQLPLDRVWEIHLAGGFEMDGFWLDAHSGAIPDPLFDIARELVPALPNLKAIIFEIFPSFVPLAGFDTIRAQIERLHELWQLRGQAHSDGPPPRAARPSISSEPPSPLSPAMWERALGALAVGQPPGTDDVARELALDPGVGVINQLIHEFRASMIVGVLRLTSRLLMLSLGADVFRVILRDFWSKTPPQQFAMLEADAFGSYLKQIDLKLPQLSKVLEFEQAVVATLTDDQPRVIAFESDPLPLLRALAEGHLPDIVGQPGRFEIEVTPDGPVSASGLSLEAVRQAFPFH
jgi:uncharacterized protein (UPF0276 family)